MGVRNASAGDDRPIRLGRPDARHPCGRSVRRAFTLLELILVVVLLGVLAAVAVPRFAGSAIWETEGEASAKQVVATLRLARRMAIDQAATNPSGFLVGGSGTIYAVYEADTMQMVSEQKRLADGWGFAASFQTAFDPLGAATGTTGTNAVLIQRDSNQWGIDIAPSTGAVRHEERGS